MESVVGKFLVWSLSIGRYIVILTEFIVIMAFLSRFKLDRDLTDLNAAIEQQKNVIESYGDLENSFTAAQKKINFLKQNQANASITEAFTFLEQNLPIDVKVSMVTVKPLDWTMTASAISATSMKATVDQIVKANPTADVSLSEVELNSKTGTIDFSVHMKYASTTSEAKQSAEEPETEL